MSVFPVTGARPVLGPGECPWNWLNDYLCQRWSRASQAATGTPGRLSSRKQVGICCKEPVPWTRLPEPTHPADCPQGCSQATVSLSPMKFQSYDLKGPGDLFFC